MSYYNGIKGLTIVGGGGGLQVYTQDSGEVAVGGDIAIMYYSAMEYGGSTTLTAANRILFNNSTTSINGITATLKDGKLTASATSGDFTLFYMKINR